jgi:hypothetical protein
MSSGVEVGGDQMRWVLCREHSVMAAWQWVYAVDRGTIGGQVLLSQIGWHDRDCSLQEVKVSYC